jgi:hypothetical protein
MIDMTRAWQRKAVCTHCTGSVFFFKLARARACEPAYYYIDMSYKLKSQQYDDSSQPWARPDSCSSSWTGLRAEDFLGKLLEPTSDCDGQVSVT